MKELLLEDGSGAIHDRLAAWEAQLTHLNITKQFLERI